MLVFCLMFNGTSALLKLLVPRTIEIEQIKHVEHDLELTRYINNGKNLEKINEIVKCLLKLTFTETAMKL